MASVKDRPNNKGQEEKPEVRERRLRKQLAKKWNIPGGETFQIKVGAFHIDRSIPKIYLD